MQRMHRSEYFEPQEADLAVTCCGSHPDGIYHDGDVLLLQCNTAPKAGDLVVIKLRSDENVIFRAFDVAGERVYVPEASEFLAPILADDPSCNVIGRAIGIQFAQMQRESG